ncbi:MAG: sulfite exporter TauE/SafE family protein [Chloroflexota bacterium]
MNRQNKPAVGPAILFSVGIGLIAISVVMLVAQNQEDASFAFSAGSGFGGRLSVAFITGLTTGGLSCLAVQGGLLASSLAHQIEQDYAVKAGGHKRGKKERNLPPQRTSAAVPIFLFLGAKLVAYTLLGFLLGWAGSFLTLSPVTRAFLMIAIGIFMVGNALRMFNVHPIFRYFSIEPPKFITRYIRRTAKGTDTFTPLFLGALTVLIPCGVTQAMMAAALATGNPLSGGLLMFAFTLGTSPVFFLVAYLTTELGARMEKFFMRFVAVTVLILGFVTLDGGLNLMGSPLSFQNLSRSLLPSSNLAEASVLPAADNSATLFVENDGYFPQTLRLSANSAVTLNLVTDGTYSCARDFVIPALGFYQLLPDTGTVQVDIPAQPSGTRMFFTCSMGMYTGMIIFE